MPLPSRRPGNHKQQTAEAVRDGRRASKLIASLKGWNRSDGSNRSASIATSSNNRNSRRGTSFTTFHEQDFTVPGKKSQLLCPFVQKSNHLRRNPSASNPGSAMLTDRATAAPDMEDNTPHQSADPICAALYAETHVSAPPSAAGSNKCPIRFLDQHSPEEVARYFETHKHEIPRSHEVCVKRYQRNENDIRKLDAKYGDLVSMLQGLGQKHQPMLPAKDDGMEEDYEVEKRSNERVESWAKAVSHDGVDPAEAATNPTEPEDDRESRFDRPLKEVRVGESPSRPWGIAVPFDQPPAPHYGDDEIPNSPPAPVVVANFQPAPRPAGQCPFGHGQDRDVQPDIPKVQETRAPRPAGQCPFGHAAQPEPATPLSKDRHTPTPQHSASHPTTPQPAPRPQPTFIPQPEAGKTAAALPQMVFNGPVFIGYPLDQAMALMQQWQVGMSPPQR